MLEGKQFPEVTPEQVCEVLSFTIKEDDDNKLVTFLCLLLAYTRDAQFNLSFNAPSATGKSFIATEVAKFFPKEDVLELGYASPQSFFHGVGEYDESVKSYIVDFEHKILIFLDQPHSMLLERLRPILSHDKYEIQSKITDRDEKKGIRTKNVIMRGFPVVVFATANLKVDEQESTRFFLLSPEATQLKIKQAIRSKIQKEADSDTYRLSLESHHERTELRERVAAVKAEHVEDVLLLEPEKIEERFFSAHTRLKPRHNRDVSRLLSLIKAFALLNLWQRERKANSIVASQHDVDSGFALWDRISESQDHNVPPYVYNIYREVILPLWNEKRATGRSMIDNGLSRIDIIQHHYKVHGKALDQNVLVMQILPMLETAGLIVQEPNSSDKRKKLVYPTEHGSIVGEQNNTSGDSGAAADPYGDITVADIPF